MNTARTPQIIIRTFIILLVGGIVLGYTYYRTLPYRLGPQVTIATPAEALSVTTSPIKISGTTERINDLHLNGRKIFTDTQGTFTEYVYVHPGYNDITIRASDRFGKDVNKHIQVHYTP